MLTISQLAAHAGVTVRAIRHYHATGLLPEPDRDHSGYRRYDAAAVVQLIKIRTLAEAGVPLARVHELLQATPDEFAHAVADIDQRLRAEIRTRQRHRQRIARLAAGDNLALPPEVTSYLEQLRATGIPETVIQPERDGWILMAARWPEQIPAMIATKKALLENPQVVRLYQLIARIIPVWDDHQGPSNELDDLLNEVADILIDLHEHAAATNTLTRANPPDTGYVNLLDSFAEQTHPATARLQDIINRRGWHGWTFLTKTNQP